MQESAGKTVKVVRPCHEKGGSICGEGVIGRMWRGGEGKEEYVGKE